MYVINFLNLLKLYGHVLYNFHYYFKLIKELTLTLLVYFGTFFYVNMYAHTFTEKRIYIKNFN